MSLINKLRGFVRKKHLQVENPSLKKVANKIVNTAFEYFRGRGLGETDINESEVIYGGIPLGNYKGTTVERRFTGGYAWMPGTSGPQIEPALEIILRLLENGLGSKVDENTSQESLDFYVAAGLMVGQYDSARSIGFWNGRFSQDAVKEDIQNHALLGLANSLTRWHRHLGINPNADGEVYAERLKGMFEKALTAYHEKYL